MSQCPIHHHKSDIAKCIILAAGASTRLRPLTNRMPKCLLEIGGKTLLERTIEYVLQADITSIAIVIGYKREMVREYIKQHFPRQRIRTIVNPNYTITNNAYSLFLARNFLENGEGTMIHPLLLLDSDILFSPGLLPYLLADTALDKISVRVSGEHNEEEIRVKVDSIHSLQKIGKDVLLEETYGESVGIEFFSSDSTAQLYRILERRIKQGQGRSEFYEASFQEMIDSGIKFKAVDISQFPVIEIDTAEDLERAQLMKLE
jgi:choline kinase